MALRIRRRYINNEKLFLGNNEDDNGAIEAKAVPQAVPEVDHNYIFFGNLLVCSLLISAFMQFLHWIKDYGTDRYCPLKFELLFLGGLCASLFISMLRKILWPFNNEQLKTILLSFLPDLSQVPPGADNCIDSIAVVHIGVGIAMVFCDLVELNSFDFRLQLTAADSYSMLIVFGVCYYQLHTKDNPALINDWGHNFGYFFTEPGDELVVANNPLHH